MAAYGHLHGWLTGALRTTVDGQRWVNVRVPGTRRLRRFAGGAVQALVLFVAVVGGHLDGHHPPSRHRHRHRHRDRCRRPPRPMRPSPSATSGCDDAANPHRHDPHDARSSPTWPKTPTPRWPTPWRSSVTWSLWLDPHDLALRIQARPRLVPIYLRFFPDLREVGTTPSLLSNETLTTLDRTPRHPDR